VLSLRALGPPVVLRDDRPVHEVADQTKRLVLLTSVADADVAGIRRDTLVALFWPELDDSHARNALRQSLAVLRRALGDKVLPGQGESVRLTPGLLAFDVADFSAALASGDLRGALALYRGDFLAGVYLPDAPEAERWIEERRASLRRKAVRAALALAEELGTGEDTAVSWAHRAVAMAPHDETAWRKLIQVHIRQGNVPAALDTYAKLCRLLREEFASEPSAETRALIAPLHPPVRQ
jgi:DNA-binding SARP family transcriptional activator